MSAVARCQATKTSAKRHTILRLTPKRSRATKAAGGEAMKPSFRCHMANPRCAIGSHSSASFGVHVRRSCGIPAAILSSLKLVMSMPWAVEANRRATAPCMSAYVRPENRYENRDNRDCCL